MPIVDCVDRAPMVALAGLPGVEVPAADDPFAYQRLVARLTPALGIDSIWVPIPLGEESVEEERFRDRYGSVYRLSAHGEPTVEAGPISSLSDLDGFDMPACSRLPTSTAPVPRATCSAPTILSGSTSPTPSSCPGSCAADALLWDLVKDPELVHALARVTADTTIATVRGAAAAGADVLFMEGDLAANKSPIFSPAHFREYVMPYYAEIVAAVHECGLPIVKRSDGYMWPLVDDLVEAGFDGYNPIQPQCMDIAELKCRLGDRLCLIGNIDCAETLASGNRDDVVADVRETLQIAAPSG